MTPIRVLVVDDSRTMRDLIAATLAREPDIAVVGAAGDAYSGREAIKSLSPDVVTLDVEMPGMSGLEFLDKIMRLRPTPVVMVSTLTQTGARTTLDALALGAVDCVAKPGLEGLADKVRAAASARLRPRPAAPAAPAPRPSPGAFPADMVIAIGASTGGVEALSEVLSVFPENCPPTLIVQHMPGAFTGSFAERLNRLCAATVAEAHDGAQLAPGKVYLAPGGARHLVLAGSEQRRCRLIEGGLTQGHRPSVDTLFHSVARRAGPRAVGIILTGMGGDGAEGLKAMRAAGAQTIGQDSATCLIYGMPRVAFELGAVERQLPLSEIGRAALRLATVHINGAS